MSIQVPAHDTPNSPPADRSSWGRDLLLLDVIAGHGRENLQHELERGDAAA